MSNTDERATSVQRATAALQHYAAYGHIDDDVQSIIEGLAALSAAPAEPAINYGAILDALDGLPNDVKPETAHLAKLIREYGCQIGHCEHDQHAAPPQPAPADPVCRTDGRCQYAIDVGAEELGHCPKGKCVMPAAPPQPIDAGGGLTIEVGPGLCTMTQEDGDAYAEIIRMLKAENESPQFAVDAVRRAIERELSRVPEGQELWLWRNGDHMLAFKHLYPCYSPGGDPMVLGEPCGRAIFRESHDRAAAPTPIQPSKCAACGGSGQVYDMLGAGPWRCYLCRPEDDMERQATGDPLQDKAY